MLRLIESLELLSNQKSFVLGIANARQKLWLLLHLKSLKIKFSGYKKFPDHYNYKESDLQKLKNLAKKNNCELLTTEKDYFRIKKSFRKNINFLKVELSIDQEKQFYKYLNERL